MTSAGGTLHSEAAEYLQRAADGLGDIGYPSSFDYLSWADACTVHVPDDPIRMDVQHLRSQVLYRSSRSSTATVNGNGEELERLLQTIVHEARRGYPSLRHTMTFPTPAGFHPASQLQSADVFQRALVLDTLLDARQTNVLDCADLIEQGILYFIRVRRRAGTGGWAYFPGLLELAPDADTLAQVARVLHKSGQADLVRTRVIPVLERYDRDSSSGNFETWLYDEEPEIGDLQRAWAHQAWGAGCDPEVLANLVTSVELIARERFEAFLTRARRRILEAQGDGGWNSTWYAGPYYGTFVCTRAIARDGTARAEVRRVRRFLEERVRNDGGWGSEDASSDPLSTALAISTLRLIDPEDRLIEKGRRFLLGCISDDATSWDLPFIRMNMGRAYGADGPILTFGSSGITMTIVAQALLENSHAFS